MSVDSKHSGGVDLSSATTSVTAATAAVTAVTAAADKQISVRFVSRLQQFGSAADSTATIDNMSDALEGSGGLSHSTISQYTYTIPVHLARDGLSELVNSLLKANAADRRIYEFISEGEFVITDLKTFIQKKQISGESVMVLEYVEAMQSSLESSRPHPDWISAIDGNHAAYLLSASYDSMVRVWDDKNANEPIATATGHTAAVKAVKWFSAAESDHFVSAGKDKRVRVWSHSNTHCTNIAVGMDHNDSIECLAVAPTRNDRRFASGSYDKLIHLWDAGVDNTDTDAMASAEKKRKTEPSYSSSADSKESSSQAAPRKLTPIQSLQGHAHVVSALCWPASTALYSGSWDHTIKQWDVTSGVAVASWPGSKVITSMSFSLHANLLATGHNDKVIRMWDPRQSGGSATATAPKEVLKASYRGHTGWVSGVAFHPSSEQPHLFASVGYDSTVRLWDIRSTRVPRQTMTIPLEGEPHRAAPLVAGQQKMLCVDWYRGYDQYYYHSNKRTVPID